MLLSHFLVKYSKMSGEGGGGDFCIVLLIYVIKWLANLFPIHYFYFHTTVFNVRFCLVTSCWLFYHKSSPFSCSSCTFFSIFSIPFDNVIYIAKLYYRILRHGMIYGANEKRKRHYCQRRILSFNHLTWNWKRESLAIVFFFFKVASILLITATENLLWESVCCFEAFFNKIVAILLLVTITFMRAHHHVTFFTQPNISISSFFRKQNTIQATNQLNQPAN